MSKRYLSIYKIDILENFEKNPIHPWIGLGGFFVTSYNKEP